MTPTELIPSIKAIAAITAREAGLKPAELQSDDRHKVIVRARHLAMWIAHHVTKASFAMVGRHIGNRDHATVINAIRRTEERLRDEPEWRNLRDRVLAKVEALKASPPAPRMIVLPVSSATVATLAVRAAQRRPRISSLVEPTPQDVAYRVRMARSYPERFRGAGLALQASSEGGAKRGDAA